MGQGPRDRADSGLALPPGSDPTALSRFLNQVHDDFVQTGQVDRALRRVVVDSWRRSLGSGLDPELSRARIRLDDAQPAAIRAAHPLAAATADLGQESPSVLNGLTPFARGSRSTPSTSSGPAKR